MLGPVPTIEEKKVKCQPLWTPIKFSAPLKILYDLNVILSFFSYFNSFYSGHCALVSMIFDLAIARWRRILALDGSIWLFGFFFFVCCWPNSFILFRCEDYLNYVLTNRNICYGAYITPKTKVNKREKTEVS